jgi:hypothetical protein
MFAAQGTQELVKPWILEQKNMEELRTALG